MTSAVDYERSYFGACLRDNALLDCELTGAEFGDQALASLWQTARKLRTEGCRVDLMTLAGERPDLAVLAAGLDASSAANSGFYLAKIQAAHTAKQAKRALTEALENLDRDGPASLPGSVARLAALTAPRGEGRAAAFSFTRADKIESAPIPWAIYKTIPSQGFGIAFGRFGSMKSFVVYDMAFSRAASIDWHGHRTKPAAVAMILGEGRHGETLRRRAWEIARGVSMAGAPLYISSGAARLGDPAFMAETKAALDAVAAEAGRLDWLIIDTWARSLFGAENDSADTGRAIADCHELMAVYGAGCLVVHHEGWTEGRTRGSTALMAAADYAIRCAAVGNRVTLSCEKMKDGAAFEPLCFELRDIDLGGLDEEGQALRSAALHLVDTDAQSCPAAPLGKNQVKALESVKELYKEHRATLEASGADPTTARVRIDDWRERAKIPRARWAEAVKALIDRGLLKLEGNYVLLTSPSEPRPSVRRVHYVTPSDGSDATGAYETDDSDAFRTLRTVGAGDSKPDRKRTETGQETDKPESSLESSSLGRDPADEPPTDGGRPGDQADTGDTLDTRHAPGHEAAKALEAVPNVRPVQPPLASESPVVVNLRAQARAALADPANRFDPDVAEKLQRIEDGRAGIAECLEIARSMGLAS